MSMERGIEGSPVPLQLSEQEMKVLTGLECPPSPLRMGTVKPAMARVSLLAALQLQRGLDSGLVQSCAQCPVLLYLKQEPFPQLSLGFSLDDLGRFKALPRTTAIIFTF